MQSRFLNAIAFVLPALAALPASAGTKVCGTAILAPGTTFAAGELKVRLYSTTQSLTTTQDFNVDPATKSYCGDNGISQQHQLEIQVIFHDNATGAEVSSSTDWIMVPDATGKMQLWQNGIPMIFDITASRAPVFTDSKVRFYGVNDRVFDKDLGGNRSRFQPYSGYYNRVVASTFGNGNLISNGSFETGTSDSKPDNWELFYNSGWTGNATQLGALKWQNISTAATTGSEVVALSYATNGAHPPFLTSSSFTVKSNTEYILSFYYRAWDLNGTFKPSFSVYKSGSEAAQATGGGWASAPNYSTSAAWTLYSYKFNSGPEAVWAKLSLLNTAGGNSGSFVFDDVLLEPAATALTTQGSQAGVQKGIVFYNGMNKLTQSLTYDKDRDVITAPEYDEMGRMLRSSLQVGFDQIDQTGRHNINEGFFGASAKGNLQWYYTNTASGAPQAGGYPYTESFYESNPLGRVTKTFNPGLAWRNANKSTEKFYASTDNLAPATGTDEAPGPNTSPKFFYTMTKGEEGMKTREFTDLFGHKVMSGHKIGTAWADAKFKYDGLGNLIEETAPNGQDAGIKTTHTYNSLGQRTSEDSPDFGLTKMIYDRTGKIRFSQTEMQSAMGRFSYARYDTFGRMVEQGESLTAAAFTQANADNPAFPGSSDPHQARVYNSYDVKLSSTKPFCADPTGDRIYTSRSDPNPSNSNEFPNLNSAYDALKASLSTIYPFAGKAIIYQVFDSPTQQITPTVNTQFQPIDLAPGTFGKVSWTIRGVLRGSQEYNDLIGPSQVDLNLAWGPLTDRLVSTLVCNTELLGTTPGVKPIYKVYNYDIHGNITDFIEYNGYVENATKRWQKVKQSYDPSNRVIRKEVLADAFATAPEVFFTYTYDHLGRLDVVRDYANAVVAKHYYDLLGRVKQIDLARGSSPLTVFFTYNFRGLLKEIKATALTRGEVFSQQLRYEDANAANGELARFDGNIAAYNYRLMGMAQELYKFEYDNANRLYKATTTKTTDLKPGSANSFQYDYYPNGAIKTLTRGTQPFNYKYATGTNMVDRVEFTGSHPRNTNPAGTFLFDNNGRLYRDYSKGDLQIDYDDAMDRPFEFKKTVNGVTNRIYMVYDEEGNRKSKLSYSNYTLTEGKHYFKEKEIREFPTVSSATKEYYDFESFGRISYNTSGGKEYEVNLKNSLGSTMEVFNTTSDKLSYKADYEPFGRLRSETQSSDEVSEKFTGKENDEEIGLDYFGARYYDPELAMWIAPDGARFFNSPYVYMGNGFNPVVSTDPDGNCPTCFKILTAFPSAYYAGYAAATAAAENGEYNEYVLAGISSLAFSATLATAVIAPFKSLTAASMFTGAVSAGGVEMVKQIVDSDPGIDPGNVINEARNGTVIGGVSGGLTEIGFALGLSEFESILVGDTFGAFLDHYFGPKDQSSTPAAPAPPTNN